MVQQRKRRSLRRLLGLLLLAVILVGCDFRPVPLRHSYGVAVPLPGSDEHTPTDCYYTDEAAKDVLCRVVHGYEETGYDKDYVVDPGIAEHTSPKSEKYGVLIVTNAGTVYEGCSPSDQEEYLKRLAVRPSLGWAWVCDYWTNKQVVQHHEDSDGYELGVLADWVNYTVDDRMACTLVVGGSWYAKQPFGAPAILAACRKGPPHDLGK